MRTLELLEHINSLYQEELKAYRENASQVNLNIEELELINPTVAELNKAANKLCIMRPKTRREEIKVLEEFFNTLPDKKNDRELSDEELLDLYTLTNNLYFHKLRNTFGSREEQAAILGLYDYKETWNVSNFTAIRKFGGADPVTLCAEIIYIYHGFGQETLNQIIKQESEKENKLEDLEKKVKDRFSRTMHPCQAKGWDRNERMQAMYEMLQRRKAATNTHALVAHHSTDAVEEKQQPSSTVSSRISSKYTTGQTFYGDVTRTQTNNRNALNPLLDQQSSSYSP